VVLLKGLGAKKWPGGKIPSSSESPIKRSFSGEVDRSVKRQRLVEAQHKQHSSAGEGDSALSPQGGVPPTILSKERSLALQPKFYDDEGVKTLWDKVCDIMDLVQNDGRTSLSQLLEVYISEGKKVIEKGNASEEGGSN
jgi:hypothetical protein